MNAQAALPRALLFLLFLHLSLPSGRSHPLGDPSPAWDLSRLQEVVDLLQDIASRLEVVHAVLGLHPQDQGPATAWNAQEAASAGHLPPPKVTGLQALPEQGSSKKSRDSGCFGQKLDAIGSVSGLGCTVKKKI